MGESRRWGGRLLALVAAGAALLGACASRPPDAPSTPSATRLAVVTQPAGTASGQRLPTQPVVEIRDTSGARVSAASDTVTVALTGTGTLVGTLTVAAVGGVATFTDLAVTGTGAFALQFTSGTLTEAVSSPFTVTAPTATRLSVLTQPAGTTSGQALTTQPVVELQDASGARVTGATGSITASLATGTGTMAGTLTVAAVGGVATFTNLAVTGSGTFTLRFSSGALTEAISSAFTLAVPTGGTILLAAGASVLKYDLATGASQGTFTTGGALAFAYDVILGPDSYVYVADFTNKTIQRFDAQSGAGRGIFSSLSAIHCSPYRIVFGPDTNLYVGCQGGSVERISGVDGSSMGTFVAAPASGGDMGGLAFYQGSLFVTYITSPNGTLVQYNATTGALVATLYSSFAGNGPRSPLFGTDGAMYVPEWQTRNVKKFAPTTHAFVGDFISDAGVTPMSLGFAPSGELLVLSDPGGSDTVRRYDATSGAFLGTLVAAGSGGLARSAAMLVMP